MISKSGKCSGGTKSNCLSSLIVFVIATSKKHLSVPPLLFLLPSKTSKQAEKCRSSFHFIKSLLNMHLFEMQKHFSLHFKQVHMHTLYQGPNLKYQLDNTVLRFYVNSVTTTQNSLL